jgi:uncharacterized membrane protein YedE/YeeE
MTAFTPYASLGGGILIGLSAVILMAGIGRIAGISGIFGTLIIGKWSGENAWRGIFIIGLLLGTVLAALLGLVDADAIAFPGNLLTTVLGGQLVGAGTALGAGCTSGHGICGIARLSPRSITATAVFVLTAIITVYILRHVIGG